MTAQFKIRSNKAIPYWESRSTKDQVKESSKRRELTPLRFIARKFNIFILTWLAYFCPIAKLRVLFNRWKGVTIGERVFIGPACILELAYPEYIYLEDDVALAGGVQIIAHSNPNINFKKYFSSSVQPVVISEGAWITLRSTILPGVKIGRYAVISCGSVVNRNVPDYAIVAGNPAKVITKLKQ